MRNIVLKVRKARSRHNRGEGAKKARAMEQKKYYKMKLIPQETIEDMEYLATVMLRSVVHGKWAEDEAMHVAEMTRLIPDWRNGYKKALRDLGMLVEEPESAEAEWTQRVNAMQDDADTGTYGWAPIVAKPASAQEHVEPPEATMQEPAPIPQIEYWFDQPDAVPGGQQENRSNTWPE
jgi:hypothetical protein